MLENYPSIKETNKILKDAQNGSICSLQQFSKKYPELHWSAIRYDTTGDTILHIAARSGHVNIIHFLMDISDVFTVDCKNNDDKTALHEACQFARLDVCTLLLKAGADANALKRADWTPLMLACTKIVGDMNYKIVELLLKHGALVNCRNKDGWTSLHIICREGEFNILHLLVKHGSDLNSKTKNGRTCLHIAALHGHLNIVEALLKGGVDVNGKDNCGNSPLHEAILSGNTDISKFLIDNGADVHCKNNSDYGLLHLASSRSNIETVRFVLDDLKWNINERNSSGLTALHCAGRNNNTDVYRYLIEKGADEMVLDDFKRKPSDYLPR